ncbi:HD domain-containing phosphohydrolase [uncultured Deinococcus sp.]|uniref:HD domain-containing phosphohydrolase n=1 Tax=uncultured Deinococcus sp. TaxID=158789 RepID=UPI00374A53E6
MPDIPLNPLTSPEPPSASGLDYARLRSLQDAATSLLEKDPKEALRLAKICSLFCLEYNLVTETSQEISILLGRAHMANANFQQAYEKFVEVDSNHPANSKILAEAHFYAGKTMSNLGNFDAAQKHFDKSLDLVDDPSDNFIVSLRAMIYNQKAGVELRRGNASQSIFLLNKAIHLWKAIGNIKGHIQCLINIGNVQTDLGQYTEAVRTLSDAYKLSKKIDDDPNLEIIILHNLAYTHHNNGDNLSAIKIIKPAYNVLNKINNTQLESSISLNLGTFYLEEGDFREAQICLEESLDKSRRINYQFGELSALNSLGNLYEKTEQPLLAYVTYHDALAIALSIGSTQGELDARLNLGRFYLHAESWDDAQTQLQLALELAERTQSAKETAAAHETLCELYKARGDAGQALHHSEELRRIERELFNAERDRQTRNLSIQFEVERAQREADSYRLRTELEQEARQMAERQVEERTAELAQAQYEVVTRLAMAAEYRDGTTGDHTRRVGVMSASLARALGWSEARAELLGIAARLHDVGKMGIPDSILLKSGKLESSEFTQMQTHTLIGATILSGGHSELLQLAEEIALTHHDRWDGTGYPRRLAGAQIPLSGRIVAVADVYDALTQIRPYKKAWTHEEAVQELRAEAGRHFDPEVVEAALHVLCGAAPQA